MEPDPVAARASSSPPPYPASATSPPWQTRVENAEVGSEVEQEEPKKEAMAGVGETLRSFMKEFGDQGEDSIILSPWLKEISTPDRPTALRFLGEKYNNLMERYKKQVVKCSEECEPRYNALKKKYTDKCVERRRLYNELIELRGNIRVFCRCRPLSSNEVNRGCLSVVEIDPSHKTELQFVLNEKEKKPFKFDHVLGPEDGQVWEGVQFAIGTLATFVNCKTISQRLRKDNEKAKDAFEKASKGQEMISSPWDVAKHMESAAALAKELGCWNEVSDFYHRASELYRECGRPQPASDALAKGASVLEEKSPEEAIKMYDEACSVIEEDGKEQMAFDLYRAAAALYIKMENIATADKCNAINSQCKAYLSAIIIYLYAHDFQQAQECYNDCSEVQAFLNSDQNRCATKLLSAYEEGDAEEIKHIAQSSAFNHLDHVAKSQFLEVLFINLWSLHEK
uniref:Gamma-soluble NSF attachment protein n=1 Tax=Zea mays TaxID=4577 RepID=A0A804RDS3_MAIZE